MRFGKPGVVLHRTTWLAFCVQCLCSCAINAPLSVSPMVIDTEWTEITPSSPIRPRHYWQEVSLEVAGTVKNVDLLPTARSAFEHPIIVIFADDRRVVIDAEARIDGGQIRPLPASGYGCTCSGEEGTRRVQLLFGARLSHDHRIAAIRLKASAPITIEKISWLDYDPL
jgi:hypothetical protein